MVVTLVLVAAAAGVADAIGSSWRHLHRPVPPSGLARGMVRQAAGSTAGILLWLGAVTAACLAHAPAGPAGLPQTATPLLAVVLTRIPVLGRPLLAGLHLLTGLLVGTTAATLLPVWAAALVTVAGYLAFLLCREAAAPRRGAPAPLHHVTTTTGAGGRIDAR